MKSPLLYTPSRQGGQALVILLVFMIVALTLISASVSLMIVNAQATTKVEQGASALAIAESGAENGLLRLLRTPTYTGETLTVGSGSVTVVVTGTTTKTITSQGRAGDFMRTIEVIANVANNILTVVSWKEVF